MTEKKEEKLTDALLKVALGYQIAEVTEEYAEVNGELKLTKRKKTKKDVPPDLKAVQLLLAEGGGQEYGEWSDERLEEEKVRLLSLLKEEQKAATDKKQATKKPTAKKTVKRSATGSARKKTVKKTK